MTRLWVVSSATLLIGGCAASGANAGDEGEQPGPPSGGPVIESVSPESGRAGRDYPVRITISGGPFHATDNVVRFGRWTVGTFPSSDGITIELSLPKTMRTAAEVPPMVLQPGRYALVVETPEGVTDAFDFVLTAGEDG